jgi:hypothetical protein
MLILNPKQKTLSSILFLLSCTAFAENVQNYKTLAEGATVTIRSHLSESGFGATGFITELAGKKYVVTNIHVLHGEASEQIDLLWSDGPPNAPGSFDRNAQHSRLKSSYQDFQAQLNKISLPKVFSQTGELRIAGSLLLSEKRDIALIPVDTDIEGLQISSEPPTRNDQVFVVGNPEAEHTLILCDGVVKATGSDRIELDIINGQLVGGMSGGPVVCSKSGKVFGAIAYKTQRLKMDDKFDFEQIEIDDGIESIRASVVRGRGEYIVRNFAFRINDKLNMDLAPISWRQFLLDCGAIKAMGERSTNVLFASKAYYRAFSGENAAPYDLPPDFDNSVAMTYESAVRSLLSKKNAEDFRKLWESYQSKLENLLNQDVANQNYQIKTIYLKEIAKNDIWPYRQKLASHIRTSAGVMPSAGR